jgi:phosphonopyruvate decarboxylase
MNIKTFIDIINTIGADFYTGVPDSQLKALCDYLMNTYGIDPRRHIIAANEGACVALAAGYHLATGKVAAVYMQNSGQGNIINPVASLLSDKVYAIPCIFIIGWRGEPGVPDEPQHAFQCEVTLKLLEVMDIATFVIGPDTGAEELKLCAERFKSALALGKSVAFVIRKGALKYLEKITYSNDNLMNREEIIRRVIKASGEDAIVATTGKTSRELFEIREANGQDHKRDFLTVGSMGHSSSIALGIALNKPNKKIWLIDGDGAALMHMGAMAVVGTCKPRNLIHILINNEAHESVGGMPTVAGTVNFTQIAKACGYSYAAAVDNYEALSFELATAKTRDKLSFIEAKASLGARANLGRPSVGAIDNRKSFMERLSAD